jgi:hypothetical protein
MKDYIQTESGSKYIIDHDAKTWSRSKGEGASEIRTDSGTFEEFKLVRISERDMSDSIQMICPPINPPYKRLIISTPIVALYHEA